MKLIKTFGIIFLIGNLFGCYSQKAEENQSNNIQNESIKPISQNVKITDKQNPKQNPIDDIPKLNKAENYKTSVQEKLLKNGWQPARSEENGKENCLSNSEICQEFPELESGPSSPIGQAILRWKKGNKVLLVHTIDDFLFDRYEYEKPEKSEAANIEGKYSYAETTGIGGEYTFEFTDKNVATLELLEEDATTEGNGFWNWNAQKEILTVTMDVTLKMAGDEEPSKSTKQIFQFRRIGKNLKVINTKDYKHLRGKIFEKN